MAFIGEKSTGWSGPRGDFIQELQESLLRVKLMGDSTMNSRLTTAACPPETLPSAACQRSAINQLLRRGQREEKLKKEKGGWGGNKDRETLRSWRKNASIHLQQQNSEIQVLHPSVRRPLLVALGVLRILRKRTTHINNSL